MEETLVLSTQSSKSCSGWAEHSQHKSSRKGAERWVWEGAVGRGQVWAGLGWVGRRSAGTTNNVEPC